MKHRIYACLFIPACLVLLAFTGYAQKDDISSRSFEAHLSKASYILMEPVYVAFTARLRSEERKPNFLHETVINVRNGDTVTEFGVLAPTTEAPQWIPQVPRANFGEKNELIMFERREHLIWAKDHFPTTGRYQVQFVFRDGSKEELRSKWLELLIEEPTGVNKRAFDFLAKRQNGAPFHWAFYEPDGIALLERFVGDFQGSVYWEHAVLELGGVYDAKAELDKAKIEYEKIKSSNSKYISHLAISQINAIERRLAEKKSKAQQVPAQ